MTTYFANWGCRTRSSHVSAQMVPLITGDEGGTPQPTHPLQAAQPVPPQAPAGPGYVIAVAIWPRVHVCSNDHHQDWRYH